MELNFNIGGAAGQGIDTIGDLLAQVFVQAGYYTFTIKDYFSRIRGGYNFTQVRVSDSPVHAPINPIDVVIALTRDAVTRQRENLTETGRIIFDDALEVDSPEDCHFAAPLSKTAREVGGNERMTNAAALGATLAILRAPFRLAEESLNEVFKKKGEKIVQGNVEVAKAMYDRAQEEFVGSCPQNLEEIGEGPCKDKLLITGNRGIALGAAAANLKWISAYPMSPSTAVFQDLVDWSERLKIAAIQAEDEIAALTMAIGASFVGARSMVTTSGGGFSLMAESLGLAAASETPVVIYNAQRPGPSTGLPTRTEQGDLLFVLFASQGEFPRIVFAPKDPLEGFHATTRAFNLAEKYQVPTMILGDQHFADSVKNIPKIDVSTVEINRGKLADDGDSYRRHEFTDDGVSPRAFPGDPNRTVVSTGNSHTQAGHISEDPEIRNKMVEKFQKKIPSILEDMNPPKRYGSKNATSTLLTWGSSWGAVYEGMQMLNEEGHDLAQLHFCDIYPLRADELKNEFEIAKSIISIEQNATSQFARLVAMETGLVPDATINKYDGRPMTPQWVIQKLKEGHI
ncbi:2-oxoacid:acceptor oxidoreductase subunit alpha [Candidatus Thorarchaeota archaeon]|nr:MAG: 2-oxoacid:acceptor oxidoreductase subunit alpha [Candidatus Thorarchaeota archaeon]